MTAVHQALPVLSSGDAIGGAVLLTQKMLRELGYSSEVFAEVLDQRLRGRARPAGELAEILDPSSVVMYHLSLGSALAHQLASSPARCVVVYHNITPPHYFEATNPTVVRLLHEGREQLAMLAGRAELCIAVSDFNASDAREAGYARIVVVPPPVDLQRLRPRPSKPQTPPYALFVGRFALNKRHDVLIRALAALAAEGLDLRLVLAGTADDNRAYTAALSRMAARLGVASRLEMHDQRITDDALAHLYACASLFATASDHEGFCVPLLEAMAFDLPIVARDAGAIPDTLAGAGLLLQDDDPLLWAAALRRLLLDSSLAATLVQRGGQRVQDFSHDRVRQRLSDVLRGAGITPS